MSDPTQHDLTYREVDDGYADGLNDVYDCSCGQTFQANGDVAEAFTHGWDAGYEAGTHANDAI